MDNATPTYTPPWATPSPFNAAHKRKRAYEPDRKAFVRKCENRVKEVKHGE